MPEFHVVRVTTDDRKHQLWVAAADTREQAISNVLDAVPEGWTATLVPNPLMPEAEATLKLKPGEVREITLSHRPSPVTDAAIE